MKKILQVLFIVSLLFSVGFVFASGGGEITHNNTAMVFFYIALMLMLGKISGSIARFGQPVVLGEILIGVILGNLFLFGIDFFEPIKHNEIIAFLAELGVIILLFQIGLESNIHEMKKVGVKSLLVAIFGAGIPFLLGSYVVGPIFMPEASLYTHLFIGAALTATSVGITARVFKDLGKLDTKEAKTILGAAVIDDVIGLIILAVISAIVTTGNVGLGKIGFIIFKSVAFLVGSIFLGNIFAGPLSKMFSKIYTGNGMKFTIAISFGLFLAFCAELMGLAPLVGAFAAGLVLDPVHFKHFKNPKAHRKIEEMLGQFDKKTQNKIQSYIKPYQERHIEFLLKPLEYFLVPIFFIYTGINVRLDTVFDGKVFGMVLIITLIAVLGKFVSGFLCGKDVKRSVIGFGMVPRGEVGLIFASLGMTLGVLTDSTYGVIVSVVILTTIITPPILSALLKK